MSARKLKNRRFAVSKVSLRSWLFVGVVCVVALAATAFTVFAAEKIPLELQGVGITEHFGEQVDLSLTFRNEKGELTPLSSVINGRQPVLLFLAYYGCPNLCNLFLNGATDGLKGLKWTSGKDFQILTISIDPREDTKLARMKKEAHLMAYGRPEAAAGWHFWVNDRKAAADANDINVKKLATQVGFGYHYDKDQDQYAHSAGMIVLTPEGKVSRYLYGIEYQPRDLKLALTEAGGGKIGTLAERILLFCYHYDPKGKKYAIYATNVMRAGGGFTVLIVGGILGYFWRRNRRRSNSGKREVESTNA